MHPRSSGIGNVERSAGSGEERPKKGQPNDWEEAGLIPLLLKKAPRHPLTLRFGRGGSGGRKSKGKGGSEIEAGEEVERDHLRHPPALDWPINSDKPEQLWTVAAIDLDALDPSLLAPPSSHHISHSNEYRTVNVAGASTPPQQKLVWLLMNVPAPHLLGNAHVLANWDAGLEGEKKWKDKPVGLHRFVVLVWAQDKPLPIGTQRDTKLHEHAFEAKDRREGFSLPNFLHQYKKSCGLSDEIWAGNFFWAEPQPIPDDVYAAVQRADTLERSVAEGLPHGVKHPKQKPFTDAAAEGKAPAAASQAEAKVASL